MAPMNTPSRTASNSRANASARVCAVAERGLLSIGNGKPPPGDTQEKPPTADNKGDRRRFLMRIFRRHDGFLVGGLAVALWSVSSRQFATMLGYAPDVDGSPGLQLVPALFILAVVFLVD